MHNHDVVDFLNSVSQISNDLVEPINIYRTLEKKYIKANNKELLDHLYKEKKVIFSYLKNFEKTSLKQVKAFLSELNNNVDLNEIKNLNSPKDIDFIRISYKQGKWAVDSKDLNNPVETKDVPTAIEYLTQIVARLDPQDAAYSLLHAKNNGLFLIAALPDPLSDREMSNTMRLQTTMDSPSNYMSRFSPSDDGMYNQNTMPVSLQAKDIEEMDNIDSYEIKEDAEELTVREGNTYLDSEEGIHIVTSVNNDVIMFSDNSIEDIEEVKEKISSGEWVRQAASIDEKQAKQHDKELKRIENDFKELAVRLASIQMEADNYRAKLEKESEYEIEALQKRVDEITPKAEKMMEELEEYEREVSGTSSKITTLRKKLIAGEFQFRPKSEQYAKRTKTGDKLMAVIEKMKSCVDPKKIKKFEKYEEELYYWSSQESMFKYKLDVNDPNVRMDIEEKTKELKKKIQTSLYSSKNKIEAYNKLDNLIIEGSLDFNTYNELSDCIEKNSEISNKYISEIYASIKNDKTPKVIEAGIFESIQNKLAQIFNKIGDWFSNFFNFITIENSKIKEINDDLDELIGE